jgi:hypothetical protein
MDAHNPPLSDALAGVAWWNALTEADRRFWLAAAITAIPAHAWEYFKAVAQDRCS